MVGQTPKSTFEGLEVKPLSAFSREEIIERIMTNVRDKLPLRLKDAVKQIEDSLRLDRIECEVMYSVSRLKDTTLYLDDDKEVVKYDLIGMVLECDDGKYEIQLKNVVMINVNSLNESWLVSYYPGKIRVVEDE